MTFEEYEAAWFDLVQDLRRGYITETEYNCQIDSLQEAWESGE